MSIVRRIGLLLVLVLCLPTRGWAEEEDKAISIKDAVRDGAGRVWGFDNGFRKGIYALDAKEQWQAATPKEIPSSARPWRLCVRTDGSAVCLWRLEDNRYQWSVHRGLDSRTGAAFDLQEHHLGKDLKVAADGKNNVWLAEEGPDIFRLAPDGTFENAHHISAEECTLNSYVGDDRGSVWQQVAILIDAGGRPWFWTSYSLNYSNGATIRGVLIYEDGKFVQHDLQMPQGSKPRPLITLGRKDAQHLWLARLNDGLYTLDITTFQAERVADQPEGALTTTFAADCLCGAGYFVMGYQRPEGRIGVLWRLSPKGQWEKLADGVDRSLENNTQEEWLWRDDRLWLAGTDGNYLGTNGNGIWFVTGSGTTVVQADWQRGFPLTSPRRLLDLGNGRWLAVDRKGGTWIGSLESLVAERPAKDNSPIKTVRAWTILRTDARGHLWGNLTNNSPFLSEWDGEKWLQHNYPAELGWTSYLDVLNLDASGRVWLRSNSQKKWCVVYDPSVDKWKVYANFDAALVAQIGRPGAEFPASPTRRDLPRFGPQGRICYLTSTWKAAAYMNGEWRQWNEPDIVGKGVSFDGPPFIGRDGRVCINAKHRTLTLTDGWSWQPTADYEPGFADKEVLPEVRPWKPPVGAKLPFAPDSAAVDNQGAVWMTWQHGLYKFREGLCVPILAATGTHPFTDGRSVGSVLIDGRGNAFLRNSYTRGEYVILPPPGPPPRTTLSEEVPPGADPAGVPPDQVTIRLRTTAAPAEGKSPFRWKLDDGAWNWLTAEGQSATVPLTGLPGGAHRFQAQSFDAALQTDPAPAVLTFEVKIDPQAQIAGYIAQLADPDFSRREAAVAALARQADAALPALRAARAGADEGRLWWIDAAIQQAEQNRK